MSLLNNKHVRLALILSPLLGLGTYLAVDHSLAEPPTAAVPGGSYPLAASSRCRYKSGACKLTNGDVVLDLRVVGRGANSFRLAVSTSVPATGVMSSFSLGGSFSEPTAMTRADVSSQQWSTVLENIVPESSVLRLAATIGGASYYVETTAIFLRPPPAVPGAR